VRWGVREDGSFRFRISAAIFSFSMVESLLIACLEAGLKMLCAQPGRAPAGERGGMGRFFMQIALERLLLIEVQRKPSARLSLSCTFVQLGNCTVD
jgi:hypothetical protein